MSEHEGLIERLRATMPNILRQAALEARGVIEALEARALAAEARVREAEGLLREVASPAPLAYQEMERLFSRIDAFLAGRTETEDAVSSDLSNVRVTGLPFTAAPPDGGVLRDPGIHPYSPSAMHMGDCSICGNVADAPVHRPGGGR